jgi:hypothetical protein
MLKDIYEDIKKYISDKKENNKKIFRFDNLIGNKKNNIFNFKNLKI